MAKLDEIAELLTEEIKSFGSWVEQLKELLKNIDDLRFEPETSSMEQLLNDHHSKLKVITEAQNSALNQIIANIKKSRWTPKWEVVIIYVVMLSNIIAFSYFGYHFIKFERQKEAAYLRGREESMIKARAYFNDHPIILKDYQKWLRKQDSTINQK